MPARMTTAQYASLTGMRSKRCREAAPLERDVQASILAYLESVGVYAIRINSGAMAGEYKGRKRFVRFTNRPGCSDIIACWRGRFVAIEVKRDGGAATLRQQQFMAEVRRAGGIAFVARSVEDVIQELTAA